MRIPSARLGLAVLGVSALLAVGATAGVALGSPSRAAAGSPIQQALQKMSRVASGRFSFTVGVTSSGTSKAGFSVGGTGGFDAKHQASTVTVNLGVFADVLGVAAGGVPVPKSLGVDSALQLTGANVCIETGSATEIAVTAYFKAHAMSYNPVPVKDDERQKDA